jgi:hypothetical protein
MKAFAALFVTLAISSTGWSASECTGTLRDLAKLNLDQKAKAYGFSSSDITSEPLQVTALKDSVVIDFTGFIYKAEYSVSVKADSSCGVESVGITEHLN